MMQGTPSVLHLSTFDISGGASRAAYRLHVGLRRLDLSSRMLVRHKASDDPDVLLSPRQPEASWHRIWRKATPYLDDLPRHLLRTQAITPISPAWLPSPIAHDVRHAAPDIVNLHWICGGFATPESLPRMKCPLVWTLHDEWAFCGGEHYTESENRFREGYRTENRPKNEGGLDVDRWVWTRKQRAYRRIERLVAVAPSRWLATRAKESALLGKRRVEHIPYGIDAGRFQPIERTVARRLLGLREDSRIVLFGTFGGINNPRKGFDLVATALHHLAAAGRATGIELVIFGSGAEGAPIASAVPTRSLGMLHDDVSLALVYAAADVYVTAATADNLPLTVMEAMACGTPVAAVAVGGMADLVHDGETGRLVAGREPELLGEAIHWVLEDEERRRRLGDAARAMILRDFTLELQAKRYAALYGEVIAGRC